MRDVVERNVGISTHEGTQARPASELDQLRRSWALPALSLRKEMLRNARLAPGESVVSEAVVVGQWFPFGFHNGLLWLTPRRMLVLKRGLFAFDRLWEIPATAIRQIHYEGEETDAWIEVTIATVSGTRRLRFVAGVSKSGECSESTNSKIVSALEAFRSNTLRRQSVELETPRRHARARKIANQLGLTGIVLSLWAIIYPKPYDILIALLAAMPLLAFLLLTRSKKTGAFELRRGNLVAALLCPPSALVVRVIKDFNFLRLVPLLTAAVLLGAILATIITLGYRVALRASPRPVVAWALIWVLAALYAYGAIAEANVLLDRSTPRTFTAAVLRKHFSSGRGGTMLYLQLDPWGPRSEGGDVIVTSSLYRAVAVNQIVCVELLPGALRIPWYYARSCR